MTSAWIGRRRQLNRIAARLDQRIQRLKAQFVHERRADEHHESRHRRRHDELRAEHADEEPDERLRQPADADDAAGERVLSQPARRCRQTARSPAPYASAI